ncbi:WD repeat-containing [Brachionus plicatilis]|uniref:WD repeat-containing n=1 Tax=Brachionus plicatilis TaxID=10195 RepID=A0A3M7SSS7_BRAPC|nr:WD repeat-containing [Brachionus plicatilis]
MKIKSKSTIGKALKHLIKKHPTPEIEAMAIDLAIDCIGKANNDTLTNILIEYLMGDHDGMPKDAKYLFKLYLSLKKYVEAAKTAVLIARQEQLSGNYRDAHNVLFSMYSDLNKENIKIPSELYQNLMILHSYVLIKIQIKQNNHLRASRLLCRVAENISKFPSHIVQILTSAVIECSRSGLHNSAFNHATMLLRPEYKDMIDPKFKKKIESLVRHPERSEIEEVATPCPNCNFKLLEYGLTCPGCQINIPYCVVTGAHLIRDDFTVCPKCDFPALYSEFMNFLESEVNCPMCSNTISRNDVKKIVEIDKYLKINEDKN